MTNVQRPQALLFDFDGVLADTEPLHCFCWQEVLAKEGIPLDWEFYRKECVGLSEREFLSAIGRRASPVRTADELWPLYPLKQKLFAEEAMRREVIPWATRSAVKSLQGMPLAVVTSSCRAEIEPILKKEGVFEWLHVCVYGDEVERLKPAPDPYLLALERLGVKQGVVFEDSEAGMTSAREAGCTVVQVRDPAELPELVKRVSNFR
jgi:HAD superfamily hydrolase (TIGR01509 family)